MLKMGIIEPSSSEWNSSIVLVPKPDGSIRFCIDFREVNKISKFDTYPLPRVDEMVERIGKAKYITTLDLCKGYWQIPLRKQDKKKTAFSTPEGLYQFYSATIWPPWCSSNFSTGHESPLTPPSPLRRPLPR